MKRALTIISLSLIMFGLVAPPARSATPTLGSYELGTSGAALRMVYDQPSVGISGSPTGEFNVARTLATSDSGTSHGLASIAWPGDLAANGGPILSQELKRSLRACEPPSLGGLPLPVPLPPIPPAPPQCGQVTGPIADNAPDFTPYPVRAETFYPGSPSDADTSVEGIRMASFAHEAQSGAESTASEVVLTGLVEAQDMASTASSDATGDAAVSEAHATVHGLSLFGGQLTIAAIDSDAKAVSDGVEATVSGNIKIAGAELGGHPITIDNKGIHADGNDVPGTAPGEALKPLTDQLKQQGISVTVAQPIDVVQGASGSRSIDGLIITMKGATAKPYFDQLPDAVKEQLVQYVQFDQTFQIIIAGLSVSASAAPPYTFGGLPSITPSTSPVFNNTTTINQGGPVISGGSTAPAPSGGGGFFNAIPVGVVGIPIALLIGALLWMLAASVGMERAAGKLTTATAAPVDDLEEDW